MPPEGVVAAAAMTRSAVFSQTWIATGGSMVRVLDVERLLRSLLPELDRRVAAARLPWTGTLRFVSEIGAATLRIGPDRVEILTVGDDQIDPQAVPDSTPDSTLELPQTALARLALGAIPPTAVLSGLDSPLSHDIRGTLEALFPHRHPHLALVDRY